MRRRFASAFFLLLLFVAIAPLRAAGTRATELYVVTPMANNLPSVDWAVSTGANALEMDLPVRRELRLRGRVHARRDLRLLVPNHRVERQHLLATSDLSIEALDVPSSVPTLAGAQLAFRHPGREHGDVVGGRARPLTFSGQGDAITVESGGVRANIRLRGLPTDAAMLYVIDRGLVTP